MISESGIKNRGSHLKNYFELQITLKIDLKVKTNNTKRWPPLFWTTYVLTNFLYSAYFWRYLSGSIKIAHPVYFTELFPKYSMNNVFIF